MSALEPVRIVTDEISPRNCQNHDESSPTEDRVSLVTAINRKYFSEQCSALPLGSTIFMKTNDHLPGKRRASGSLELLVLNEEQISVTGDVCQLSPMVRNIMELNLAFNQLSNWREVLTMLAKMPQLVHANLSHNPLSGSLVDDADWLSDFLSDLKIDYGIDAPLTPRLTSLVLNATGIQWVSLFTVLELIPNLDELHLSLNDYSGLDSGDEAFCIATASRSFPNVHNLHLNHCQLKSWGSLLAVCRLFPCLETLIAAGNFIPTIGGATDDVKAELVEYFGCLHTLNANSWPLGNWDDVDRIRKFPLLSELRINHVPFLQPFNDVDRRNLLIARLPDVTSLNGSPVTSEQREIAERFFLRFYLDAETKPERYLELESIHGRLMPLADVDLSPKDSAEVVLIMDDRRERRRVALNQTVAELKKSLQTFCHMPPGRFRVFFRHAPVEPNDSVCFEDELRYPKIMIHSLQIEDGDEFLIQVKPETTTRRRTSSSNSAPCSSNSPSKSSSCANCLAMTSPVKR